MTPKIPKLTKQVMEDAFDEMGRMAFERGHMFEVAVFGGSCLILASNIRDMSSDIDAVYLNNSAIIQDIADHVGRKMNLPQDWLNQGVRRMAYPPGGPGPDLFPFGDYPRNAIEGVGLRVFVPSPEYMLAMKIFANRELSNIEKIKTDLIDAVGLMEVTGIKSVPAMIELMEQYYNCIPGLLNPVKPRLKEKMNLLVEEYERSENGNRATWNVGRGNSSRQP